tara:strand:+ start:4466 stop:4645 length:180 start_codon:yes stop_codon:yes gene_type:complete
MRRLIQTFFLFLMILFASSLSGCFTATEDESSLPWGRPASWENSMPGMPGMPGMGGGYR